MKIAFSLIRLAFYLSAIPMLVFAIKNKNAKALKDINKACIISILYLMADLFIFQVLFDVNTGFGILFVAFMSIPASILFLISALVSTCRRKKFNLDECDKKRDWTKLYIVPIVIIITQCFFEILALNNANIILVNRVDGFGGDYYSVAVTNHHCVNIDLGEHYFPKYTEVDYIQYTVCLDENQQLVIRSYQDENLNEIDMELVEKLCAFDNYDYFYRLNPNAYREWTINKLGDTNYYHVSVTEYIPDEVHKIIGEGIFLNDEFVDNIEIGDYRNVYIVN